MAKILLSEKTLATLPLPTEKGERLYFWDTETKGFGVEVSASGRKTFVARVRVGAAVKKEAIGAAGHPRPFDGAPWTVKLARIEAMTRLGAMVSGQTTADKRKAAGPTLADGLAIHVARMAITGGKGRSAAGGKLPCSQRSIDTMTTEVTTNLKDWLDRPIVDLTVLELTRICKEIRERTPARAGSANPPGAALTKRLVSHVGAIWKSTNVSHRLPLSNPAPDVAKYSIVPREHRLEPHEFAPWRAKVEALAPIRRDFNLLALFTGIRSEGLRHVRWEDVDFDEHVLHVTRAKGNRPYTVPMTATVERILRARQEENKAAFADHGGDHGWVLPTLSRNKPYRVIPLASAKEYELGEKGERVKALHEPHALRKTWNSVAIEARIPPDDREALMNHEGKGVNVRHYGFPRSWEGLRESAQIVEAVLWQRLDGKPGRAKLRAV